MEGGGVPEKPCRALLDEVKLMDECRSEAG